jgi:hypothetical protein
LSIWLLAFLTEFQGHFKKQVEWCRKIYMGYFVSSLSAFDDGQNQVEGMVQQTEKMTALLTWLFVVHQHLFFGEADITEI